MLEKRGSSFGVGWGMCEFMCRVRLLAVEVVVSICGRGLGGNKGEVEGEEEEDVDEEGLGTLNVPIDSLI